MYHSTIVLGFYYLQLKVFTRLTYLYFKSFQFWQHNVTYLSVFYYLMQSCNSRYFVDRNGVVSPYIPVSRSASASEKHQILNTRKNMLYEKMKSADKNRDIDAFMELVHDDFVFVKNQNGADVDRTGFYEGRKMMYASDKVTREKERCIYENDDIIVEHLIMSLPDDTKEAVMGVWTKKDGKLIGFENEDTPIK